MEFNIVKVYGKCMKRVISRIATLFKGIQITLPIAIIIGVAVFSISLYFVQVNKSKSIEKQQQIELEAKKEKENREYVAERKLDCLAIYKTESDKWNNVRGWNYVEPSDNPFDFGADTCEIIYENSKYNKGICAATLAEYEGESNLDMRALIIECDETFTKSF